MGSGIGFTERDPIVLTRCPFSSLPSIAFSAPRFKNKFVCLEIMQFQTNKQNKKRIAFSFMESWGPL